MSFAEGSSEIIDQISEVFQPHAHPDQPIGDACSLSCRGVELTMRGGGRVRDQTVGSPETGADPDEPQAIT